jgi:hypothetical protein
MARLIHWPGGLQIQTRQALSGPRTIGAGSSESIGGYIQSVASPFGLWRWQLSFPPLRREAFRRYRGMISALHGGANAVRVPFCDPDRMSWADTGTFFGSTQLRDGLPWDTIYEDRGSLLLGDGTTGALLIGDGSADTLMADTTFISGTTQWDVDARGVNWRASLPQVTLGTALSIGDTNVVLTDQFWGHNLGEGDYIGFGPVYFGLHLITQVYSDGHYKVWPPIRKNLTTNDWATLNPVMAMRLESEDAGPIGRGNVWAEGLSATFVEVLDADVRAYFKDFA